MSIHESIQKLNDNFNRHDTMAIMENYADSAIVYDSFYQQPIRGKAAIEEDFINTFRAFPDMLTEMRTVLAKDNLVAVEYVAEATNDGALVSPDAEIPATGKRVKFDIAIFSRFDESGKIVEEHRYYNVANVLEQMGLMNLKGLATEGRMPA